MMKNSGANGMRSMKIIHNPIHAAQFLRPRVGTPGVMPRAVVQSIDDRIAICKDIRRRRTITNAANTIAASAVSASSQPFDYEGCRSFWRSWANEIETMPEGDALRIEEAVNAHFSGWGNHAAWRKIMRGLFERNRARENAVTPPRTNPHAWGAPLHSGW
jgi:hypothetical protein